MRIVFVLSVCLSLVSCGVQHRLQHTDVSGDNSYVYQLPYPEGKNYLVVQGYNSKLSHKGRLALDFKMKKGSPIHAARGGVVTSVEESFKKGGVSKKYYRKANAIIIRHQDGSNAMYAHLMYNGSAVNVGDTVQQGQLIGYSGSTGYSLFPHLHFLVWGPKPGGGRGQLPVRFQTKEGAKYLKPGKRYRAVSTDNL